MSFVKQSWLKIRALFTMTQDFHFDVPKLDFVRLMYTHIPPVSKSEERNKDALETSFGYFWSGSTKKDIDICATRTSHGGSSVNLGVEGDENSVSIKLIVYPEWGLLFFFGLALLMLSLFLIVGYLSRLMDMVAGAFAVVTPMFVLLVLYLRKEMKKSKEVIIKEIYNVVSHL